MEFVENLQASVVERWPAWLVTITLIVAAIIDGWKLKVPNWITFPMVFGGWIYSFVAFGVEGLGWSLLGTVVGLLVLLPAYAVGGMGAGDVKLMAGIGAWGAQLPTGQSWSEPTLYAFCASAAVGGVIAVAMVLWRRSWEKHRNQFWTILSEFATIRDPEQLAEIAAQRKSSMLLLPYGIPIAIGTIGYFAWMRILI